MSFKSLVSAVAAAFLIVASFATVSCSEKEDFDDMAVEIISESPLYMEEGASTVRVRFRCKPENLPEKKGAEVFLCNEFGIKSGLFTLQNLSKEGDGIWCAEVAFVYSESMEADLAIGVSREDKTAVSGVITVKKTAVELKSVSYGGKAAAYDEPSATFTLTIPTETDFSSVVINFDFRGEMLTVNGEELKNGVTPIDASAPVTLVGRTGSLQKEYRLVIRNTGLPVVRIQTPGNKSVTSKETWMEGASMRIENPDGTVDFEGTMSIRGRGNSTWNYPKKPYAVKLDSKAKVLGMPKHKRWVLLANWKDRTLLRNDAAFWLSRQTGLPYTVRGQFVEVEFNGKHVGNYYLCEQIKIDKNRVDIDEMEPQETDPELITGGYLMELDTYFDEPRRFRSKYFNHPYQFKEPDEEDLSDAAYNYMVNYIAELEKLMRDTQRVKDHEYEEYYDVDSAIWFMFINELATNTDFHNYWPSEGPHSMYLYKARGGKLYTGPVWDFDFHGFLPSLSHQWAGADKALYYPTLYKDERFRSRMLELWDGKKDTFRKLTAYIDEMAEHIRLSEEFNHALWPIPTYQNENGDEQMTFQQAVERIKQGFTQKLEWMDKHLADLR